MNIPINFLKHYLKNAYFFCGTACGGKTTISKAFADKYSFFWLSENTLNKSMSELADPRYQRQWRSIPTNWEEYFNRPYQEYYKWLQDCMIEQIPLMILELIKRSAGQTVAVDFHLPVNMALELAAPNHVVFMVTSTEQVIKDYFNRPGHSDIRNLIMTLKDPEKSLTNTNMMLAYGNQKYLDDIYQSGAFYIMRDENSTIDGSLALVERHFGLNSR